MLKSKIAALVELAPISASTPAGDLAHLADELAQHIAAMNPHSTVELLSHPFVHDTSRTVGEVLAANSARIVRHIRWHAGDLEGRPDPGIAQRVVA